MKTPEAISEDGGANGFEGENLVFGESDSITFHEIDLPDTENPATSRPARTASSSSS